MLRSRRLALHLGKLSRDSLSSDKHVSGLSSPLGAACVGIVHAQNPKHGQDACDILAWSMTPVAGSILQANTSGAGLPRPFYPCIPQSHALLITVSGAEKDLETRRLSY